jgi:sodium/hydrogen antiporter
VPFVLFFLTLAGASGGAGPAAAKLIGEAAFGAVVGAALGVVAGRLHHRLPGGGIARRYEGIYAVGFGLAAFGLADVTIGNGFIAAFVCGLAMGATEHEIPAAFGEFAENVSAISQVITFFVFGALIYTTGYGGEVWQLAIFIVLALLVARPIAIALSFVRARFPRPQLAFIAWFGPKGVASMLFALFVLDSHAPDRSIIFSAAAFTVIASIVAHGLTDTLGARWIERRMEASDG